MPIDARFGKEVSTVPELKFSQRLLTGFVLYSYRYVESLEARLEKMDSLLRRVRIAVVHSRLRVL